MGPRTGKVFSTDHGVCAYVCAYVYVYMCGGGVGCATAIKLMSILSSYHVAPSGYQSFQEEPFTF